MSLGTSLLRTLVEVWGGTNAGFTATLLLGLFRLARRPLPSLSSFPPIVLLRPCEGAEPGLYDNLLSSLDVAYPGPLRVLFLVPSAQDPASAVAHAVVDAAERSVVEGSQRFSATVLTTAPRLLENRKVAQLIVGLANCDEEVVVCADSDVRLGGGDLVALVGALLDPKQGSSAKGVGAAFAAPVEVAAQTGWDRAAAAIVGGSTQSFLALYGFHHLVGGSPSMAGALWAFHRSALADSGGLDCVRDCLGEDNELARRLVATGYSVALSRLPARCYDSGRDGRAAIARVARWLTVIRSQRPLLFSTYPLLLAAMPLLLVMALLLRSPILTGFTSLVVLLRLLLCRQLRRLAGLPCGFFAALVEVLLAEGLLLLGFVRAATSRRIRWRGYDFLVERGGRLRRSD